jgi:L-asparaginase II
MRINNQVAAYFRSRQGPRTPVLKTSNGRQVLGVVALVLGIALRITAGADRAAALAVVAGILALAGHPRPAAEVSPLS